MRPRQNEIGVTDSATLRELRSLPRPVYGHVASVANRAISYRHSHKWVQLSYAVHGVLQVSTDAGRYAAPPLFAVWIPAAVSHRVSCAPGTQIRSLYIEPDAVAGSPSACRVIAVTPLLRELIRTFSEFPVEYDEHGREGRLVAVLLDQLNTAPDIGLTLPWPNDRRLRRICQYLRQHPDSKRDLADFCGALDVSEKTISRLFLKETGLGFRLWRQRLRLLASLPLLEQGQRVTDVAVACGYDSMSAYISAFRAQMGMTPRDFFPQMRQE